MPTISAYTSDELKKKIDRIVREEGRNQAQVGSTALALYAALPAAARRAFLELAAADAETDPGLAERVMSDVARVLLDWKWRLLDERVAEEGRRRSTLPEGELDEDEIAELAVELSAKRSPRKRRAG